MIYNLLGIFWVSSSSVLAEVWAWGEIQSTKNIVKIISLTIFWVIWKEKNFRAFKGVEVDSYKLKDT